MYQNFIFDMPTRVLFGSGALDRLIAAVGCADLRMSETGIRKEELKK